MTKRERLKNRIREELAQHPKIDRGTLMSWFLGRILHLATVVSAQLAPAERRQGRLIQRLRTTTHGARRKSGSTDCEACPGRHRPRWKLDRKVAQGHRFSAGRGKRPQPTTGGGSPCGGGHRQLSHEHDN